MTNIHDGIQACMVTDCTKDMSNSSHGLCRTHYKMILGEVKKGTMTWQELEKAGKTLPAKFTKDGKDREKLEAFILK